MTNDSSLLLSTTLGAVTAHSGEHRLFTRAQRLALAATYRGCTFPDCDVPLPWCEIHHIEEWVHGGKTTLHNVAPLCGYHHRHFDHLGWECITDRDRIVAFRPPRWLDPDRRPRRNERMLRRPRATLGGYGARRKW